LRVIEANETAKSSRAVNREQLSPSLAKWDSRTRVTRLQSPSWYFCVADRFW